jgi:hypothetical protein
VKDWLRWISTNNAQRLAAYASHSYQRCCLRLQQPGLNGCLLISLFAVNRLNRLLRQTLAAALHEHVTLGEKLVSVVISNVGRTVLRKFAKNIPRERPVSKSSCRSGRTGKALHLGEYAYGVSNRDFG